MCSLYTILYIGDACGKKDRKRESIQEFDGFREDGHLERVSRVTDDPSVKADMGCADVVKPNLSCSPHFNALVSQKTSGVEQP